MDFRILLMSHPWIKTSWKHATWGPIANVLGSEHVFKLLSAIFGSTVRFEDTFLLLGQGAEDPIKDLWQFIFSSVYKGPHELSFPTYDNGAILTA